MANNTDLTNLKRLIDIGKDKGYITYEELNDDLPEEVVSSDYIDDLMIMFEEMNILVIDEATRVELEKAKRAKKKQEKTVEKEIFEPMRKLMTSFGSVKMYLKEMGCISLLTRGKSR
jgi:RNA polymerase primary sigma factor